MEVRRGNIAATSLLRSLTARNVKVGEHYDGEAGNASQTVRHSRHAERRKHSKTQQSVGDAGGGVDFMTLLAGLGEGMELPPLKHKAC